MRYPSRHQLARFLVSLSRPGALIVLSGLLVGVATLLRLQFRGVRAALRPTALNRRQRARLPFPTRNCKFDPASTCRLIDIGINMIPAEPTCLRRSITQQRILERSGIASRLQVGVRRATAPAVEGKTIEAHAWLEISGSPINDVPDIAQQYAVFSSDTPIEALLS